MNKMYEEGGLATDGMSVDPVSGNDIPNGSNAEDVRDDIDAQLSPGEYVVPADVVKYFGVAHFEKLRDKAKSGLEGMDDDGRIGGDPVEMNEGGYSLNNDMGVLDGYAAGGLAEGTDIDGIINRVKAAAEADPSIINMLKSKGIFMEAPKVGKAEAPSIATQPKPQSFAEGGFAAGSQPRSNFNPADYPMGFSIAAPSGATPSAPVAPVCPEGYTMDPTTKVCMPTATTTPGFGDGTGSTTSSRRGNSGSSTSNRPTGNSNAWMEKYNYQDPEDLFKASMESVATSAVEEGKESQGIMGRMGQSFLSGNGLLGGLATGLAGGVLGKFMSATNSAQVSANVMALEAMGRQDLADQLKTQVGLYDKESGLPEMLGGMYDGDQLFNSLKLEKGDLLAQRAPQATPGLGSPSKSRAAPVSAEVNAQVAAVSAPSTRRNNDNDTSAARENQRERDQKRTTQAKSVAQSEKTQSSGTTSPSSRSTSNPSTGQKTETYASKVQRGGGFAKGGLVKRRNKK